MNKNIPIKKNKTKDIISTLDKQTNRNTKKAQQKAEASVTHLFT